MNIMKFKIGDKIKDWEIVSSEIIINDKIHYELKCSCGKIELKKASTLNLNRIGDSCRSCGQLKRRKTQGQYKINDAFMNLTIIGKSRNDNKPLYKVRCICGHEFWTGHSNLYKKKMLKSLGYCNACFSADKKAPKRNTMLTSDISLTIFKKIEREAIRRGIVFNLTPEYLQHIYDESGHKCKYSGLDIPICKSISKKSDRLLNLASLDRVDSSIGYIEGNVQWVHKEVNYMKYKLSHDRFIELSKLISNNHANPEPSL